MSQRTVAAKPSKVVMMSALAMFGWMSERVGHEPRRWRDPLGLVGPLRTEEAYELVLKRIRSAVIPPDVASKVRERVRRQFTTSRGFRGYWIGGAS